ncbi:MAG: MbcA/ParS/Xre antitoxin family protein [Rhodocyclaceae bacterium]|nr:MbcA/ParS/Xre antitoxin family protein [Rhodocyclaceae bacterium]
MPQAIAANVQDRARILSHAVAEVARHLDINSTELGNIIGVSQPSASRLMRDDYTLSENAKAWELAVLLVRLYRGLYSIVGSNNQLAKDWLKSRNSAFGNEIPFAEIQKASGLVHACDYIDAHRAPA